MPHAELGGAVLYSHSPSGIPEESDLLSLASLLWCSITSLPLPPFTCTRSRFTCLCPLHDHVLQLLPSPPFNRLLHYSTAFNWQDVGRGRNNIHGLEFKGSKQSRESHALLSAATAVRRLQNLYLIKTAGSVRIIRIQPPQYFSFPFSCQSIQFH